MTFYSLETVSFIVFLWDVISKGKGKAAMVTHSGSSRSRHVTPCFYIPGERASGTHLLAGWVDPKFGLDLVARTKFTTPDWTQMSCHVMSLLRLSYSG